MQLSQIKSNQFNSIQLNSIPDSSNVLWGLFSSSRDGCSYLRSLTESETKMPSQTPVQAANPHQLKIAQSDTADEPRAGCVDPHGRRCQQSERASISIDNLAIK